MLVERAYKAWPHWHWHFSSTNLFLLHCFLPLLHHLMSTQQVGLSTAPHRSRHSVGGFHLNWRTGGHRAAAGTPNTELFWGLKSSGLHEGRSQNALGGLLLVRGLSTWQKRLRGEGASPEPTRGETRGLRRPEPVKGKLGPKSLGFLYIGPWAEKTQLGKSGPRPGGSQPRQGLTPTPTSAS